jgi:hypothetical protein
MKDSSDISSYTQDRHLRQRMLSAYRTLQIGVWVLWSSFPLSRSNRIEMITAYARGGYQDWIERAHPSDLEDANIRHRMRYHIVRIAYEMNRDRVQSILVGTGTLGLLFGWIFLIWEWLTPEDLPMQRIIGLDAIAGDRFVLFLLVSTAIVFLLVMAAASLKPILPSQLVPNVALILCGFILASLAFRTPEKDAVLIDSEYLFLNTVFVSASAVAVGIGLVVVQGGLFLDTWLEWRARKRHPDSLFIMPLLVALLYAKGKSSKPADFEVKRTILQGIELAADQMERCIPTTLRSGDTETDAWIHRRAREMAWSLRGLKREILTTDGRFYDHFVRQLQATVALAATGQWNQLPRDRSTKSKQQRIRNGMINVAATTARAALPLAILWVAEKFVEIPESALKYLLAGSLVWACLTVIAAFDPLFSVKIGALKDVGDLISSARGDRQKQ